LEKNDFRYWGAAKLLRALKLCRSAEEVMKHWSLTMLSFTHTSGDDFSWQWRFKQKQPTKFWYERVHVLTIHLLAFLVLRH